MTSRGRNIEAWLTYYLSLQAGLNILYCSFIITLLHISYPFNAPPIQLLLIGFRIGYHSDGTPALCRQMVWNVCHLKRGKTIKYIRMKAERTCGMQIKCRTLLTESQFWQQHILWTTRAVFSRTTRLGMPNKCLQVGSTVPWRPDMRHLLTGVDWGDLTKTSYRG